jgi:hypothetical protein
VPAVPIPYGQPYGPQPTPGIGPRAGYGRPGVALPAAVRPAAVRPGPARLAGGQPGAARSTYPTPVPATRPVPAVQAGKTEQAGPEKIDQAGKAGKAGQPGTAEENGPTTGAGQPERTLPIPPPSALPPPS